MARASRSSAQPETKKRKRDSEGDTQPRKRSQSDHDTHEPEEISAIPELPLCGSLPLRKEEATKILAILEKLDHQGLLDRTFPLEGDNQGAKSLKALLEQYHNHPLSVLRTAVNHLQPISSHPRAPPSLPAVQQARFCDTALSLLDQASKYTAPIIDIPPSPHIDQKPPTQPLLPNSRRYALLQQLPTGDHWSSLNNSAVTEHDLHNLSTGHAQLVAVLPDPPPASNKPIPTLAKYAPRSYHRHVPAKSRRIRRGTFLDYGHFSSFAPSFDQDAGEVGRDEVGEFYWWKERVRKAQEAAHSRAGPSAPSSLATPPSAADDTADVEMTDPQLSLRDTHHESSSLVSTGEEKDPTLADTQNSLPPDQVELVNIGNAWLDLERSIQELLDRNARAMQRLEELQAIRVSQGAVPQEGTEEWDTANAILASLTILTQLRPRASQSFLDDPSPLIPSASVLRKLHRTLPLTEIDKGWQGTLPPGKSIALRDDSTIKVTSKAPTTTRGSSIAQNASASNPSFFATPSPSPYTYVPPSSSSTPQPYSAPSTGWFRATNPPSVQQNSVIANTVQRAAQASLVPSGSSPAPPLPSHLRTSYRS